jgi:chloramphenicol 3-O phosphotransferase
MSVPPQPGKVIVLNGTSSSGKSTLATAIQRIAPELQFLHVQLDAFRAMEPVGYWSAEHKEQAKLRLEALCRALHGAAAQFARCGQNVLLDHVLSPSACTYLKEDLAGAEVLLVKVACDPQTLDVREAERGNRPQGLARSQLPSVHAACHYDFEVDTTSEQPEQSAHRVLNWLKGKPLRSAFALMRSTSAV